MDNKQIFLGIDLGTTNSSAAIFDGDSITNVRNNQGAHLTPSVVRIDARGRIQTGAHARRHLETDPTNTSAEFKRLMGTAHAIEFPSCGQAKKPEELAAEVLRAIRQDVHEQFGFLPKRAVISVPALFELPQCAATSKAGQLAGFEQVELIQEPVASAIACGWRGEDSLGKWLVYDLGGGTFDVSLLETKEGLLRVAGHDGDNYLGGKDFDWLIVDWILEIVNRERGLSLSRSDSNLRPALDRLKHLAEEAKISLSRNSEADVFQQEILEIDGQSVDIDVCLTRQEFESRCLPLIDRTINVCKRLLRDMDCQPDELHSIVLVGGPTLMPILRDRLRAAFNVKLNDTHDPMTIVARGAAIFALTANLNVHPDEREDQPGIPIWLQFPAMSADLTPYVMGRVATDTPHPSREDAPTSITITREKDGWTEKSIALRDDATFVTTIQLLPRQTNQFQIEGVTANGNLVPLHPSSFQIVHGLTVNDPPLSQTIGIATADDTVRIYFERGTPLPARRTFSHRTIQGISKTNREMVLNIPIVQGEYHDAHLCRLIGTLEISALEIKGNLPSGSRVEVTLEISRGGILSAQALLPDLNQTFTNVVHLLVPDVDPESLKILLETCLEKADRIRQEMFRFGDIGAIRELSEINTELTNAKHLVEAAKGGDKDTALKANRILLEVDAIIEAITAEQRWQDLTEEADSVAVSASSWVSAHGTIAEQQILADSLSRLQTYQRQKNLRKLQNQIRTLKIMRNTAYFRQPESWIGEFLWAASHLDETYNPELAQRIAERGHIALKNSDILTLKNVTIELWDLFPPNEHLRKLSFESSLQ